MFKNPSRKINISNVPDIYSKSFLMFYFYVNLFQIVVKCPCIVFECEALVSELRAEQMIIGLFQSIFLKHEIFFLTWYIVFSYWTCQYSCFLERHLSSLKGNRSCILEANFRAQCSRYEKYSHSTWGKIKK